MSQLSHFPLNSGFLILFECVFRHIDLRFVVALTGNDVIAMQGDDLHGFKRSQCHAKAHRRGGVECRPLERPHP